jgi:hypothetical protein
MSCRIEKYRIEAGELKPSVQKGRVTLAAHVREQVSIELDLSALAAHSLALVLPELARTAADHAITDITGMPGFLVEERPGTTGKEDL